MEEVENIAEQPTFEGSSDPIEVEQQVETGEAERGVPVGKFKSVEDLYDAYNNLQSEFTRKCQKLAELEKDKTQKDELSVETKLEDEFKVFLAENHEAAAFAEQIKNEVLQNEELKTSQKPFDKVWSKMIYEKFSLPNKAKEPLVQNFVLNDEELKNLVIEKYVKELSQHKAPTLMTTSSGERVTKPALPKPDTFEQAKSIVLGLLS